MKKILKGILVVFAVLIVITGVLAYMQRDNIKALLTSFRLSSNNIEDEILNNNKKLEKLLKEKYNVDVILEDDLVKKPSSDDSGKSDNPSGSSKDAEQPDISGNESPGTSAKPVVPSTSGGTTENNDTSKKNTEDLITEQINKIYEIKSKYLGKLADVEALIIADYEALSKEERTTGNKKDIVMKYIDYVADLEVTCDGEVKAVVDYLSAELTARNESTEIIDAIYDAYANEKELKKAYYLKKFY